MKNAANEHTSSSVLACRQSTEKTESPESMINLNSRQRFYLCHRLDRYTPRLPPPPSAPPWVARSNCSAKRKRSVDNKQQLGRKKKKKNMDLSPKGEWAPTVPACLLSTCLVRSSARLARGSYQKLLKDLDDRLLWERWVIFGEPRRDGKDKKEAVLQPLTSVTG